MAWNWAGNCRAICHIFKISAQRRFRHIGHTAISQDTQARGLDGELSAPDHCSNCGGPARWGGHLQGSVPCSERVRFRGVAACELHVATVRTRVPALYEKRSLRQRRSHGHLQTPNGGASFLSAWGRVVPKASLGRQEASTKKCALLRGHGWAIRRAERPLSSSLAEFDTTVPPWKIR